MAKANKAAKKKQEEKDQQKEIDELEKKIFQLKPINEAQGYQFQEMFDLNKTYAGYMDQYRMHQYAIAKKDDEINNYRNGNWKPPLIVQLNKQSFREVTDVDEIVKRLETEKDTLSKALESIRWQMRQKRDEFKECILRCRTLLDDRIDDEEIKEFSAARATGGKYREKELESLSIDLEGKSDVEIKKELEEAKKKIKVNK